MRTIPLRRRDGSVRFEAIVDDDVYDRIGHLRWCFNGGYVGRYEGKRWVPLSRLVMGLAPYTEDRREVDHKDGNTLDNRRSNLRVVTPGQNRQNLKRTRGVTSAHRGVSYDNYYAERGWTGVWLAQVNVAGKCVYRKRFATEEEAAHAAREARSEHMTHSEELMV
jgi:hypothetical protein